MNNIKITACHWPILFGIILIIVGFCLPLPGGALTTYESQDGESTDGYVFDNKYSAIDEYINGDAYNYIIGATLVAGKMTGMMTAKAICCVGGALCLCAGLTLVTMQNQKNAAADTAGADAQSAHAKEAASEDSDKIAWSPAPISKPSAPTAAPVTTHAAPVPPPARPAQSAPRATAAWVCPICDRHNSAQVLVCACGKHQPK